MLHGLELELRPCVGMCQGVLTTQPIDEIWASRNGEQRRIGHIDHKDGAAIRLDVHIKPELREPIRREVERLRLANKQAGVLQRVACPPNPELVKAYLKGELRKPTATVVSNWGHKKYSRWK